jgi:uncharacterized protein (TIGR02265 family)
VEFVAARFDQPVDLEGHLRLLPPGATCKGIFFNSLLDAARVAATPGELAQRAGIAERRYVSFSDYPTEHYLRLLVCAAQALSPRRPPGEAIRRLGHATYDDYLGSQVGKVVFGVLGVDVHMILKYGSKPFQIALNFGKHWNERIDEKTWRSHYEGLPVFIETHQVGILERMLERCGTPGTVRVAMTDLGNAVVETKLR